MSALHDNLLIIRQVDRQLYDILRLVDSVQYVIHNFEPTLWISFDNWSTVVRYTATGEQCTVYQT